MSLRPVQRSRTRPSGSATGSFFSRRPFTALKSAVFAPMPSASETSTTAVQPFDWNSSRTACRRSFSMLLAAFAANERGERSSLLVVTEPSRNIDVGVARRAGHWMRRGDGEQHVRRLEVALHAGGRPEQFQD